MLIKKIFFLFALALLFASNPSFSSNNRDVPFTFRGEENNAENNNPVQQMHRHITSTFDEMFRNFFNNGGFTSAENGVNPLGAVQIGNDKFLPFSENAFGTFPKTDVVKSKDKIDISIELPGVDKDKISLEIAPSFLTISYNDDVQKEQKDKNYYIAERRVGSVRRVIPLPYGAKIDEAEASYKNGVIYVSVPTEDESKFKPRKLKIK
ncbi:MAG: Hsp20/alpha crystallin family protein [Rickettsiales bacterium]|nr:Hsp20/alpha crystallin family protein [Rickettsiales bacterium]